MKRFIAIAGLITICFIIALCYIYKSMKKNGFEKIESYDDFLEFSENISVRIDNTDSGYITSNKDAFMDQLKGTPGSEVCILVVKAGNEYYQKTSFIQDALVEKVILGNPSMADSKIYISRSGGIEVRKDDELWFHTLTCVNVMRPGERYLAFCERSEVNDLVDPSVGLFRLVAAKFALLHIGEDDNSAISEYNEDGGDCVADYNTNRDRDFLTVSEGTLKEYNEIKHELFNEYGVE